MEEFDAKYRNASLEAHKSGGALSSLSAWALMIIPTWEGGNPMYGIELDVASAEQKSRSKPVTGFNSWDEMTRKFALDKKEGIFYLPQANFTGPGKDQDRVIYLYKTNPRTGSTVRREVVGGPRGLVTGFAFDAKTASLIMATKSYSKAGTAEGYDFWQVDPSTGKAVLLSKQTYGTGANTYSGYFKTLSYGPSGELMVYRLGYLNVVQSLGPGMGVTVISNAIAKYSWITIIPAKGYDFLLSMSVANVNGSSFVGLAAEQGVLSHDLSLFRWTINLEAKTASALTLVSSLGDANNTPYFGPLGFDVSPDFKTFAALTVHDSEDSDFDLWALSTCDLETNKGSTSILSPLMMAQTDSISGFGLV